MWRMQFYVALYLNVQERSGFNFIGGKNYTIYVSQKDALVQVSRHTTTRKCIPRQEKKYNDKELC
jgi:hypothetical protein